MSQVRNKNHKDTKRTAEEEQEYVKKGKQTKHLLVEGEKENMWRGKRTKHLLVATYLYKNVSLNEKQVENTGQRLSEAILHGTIHPVHLLH